MTRPRSKCPTPSRFQISISGIIPVVGVLMALIEIFSGHGKLAIFYAINATVCVLLSILGLVLIVNLGILGGMVGFGVMYSFLAMLIRKVEDYDICF